MKIAADKSLTLNACLRPPLSAMFSPCVCRPFSCQSHNIRSHAHHVSFNHLTSQCTVDTSNTYSTYYIRVTRPFKRPTNNHKSYQCCLSRPLSWTAQNSDRIFMAALCNRAGHYIFDLWFLLLSSFFLLFSLAISAVADWLDVCHTSSKL